MKQINCPINCNIEKIIDEINVFPRAADKGRRIANSKNSIVDLSNKLKINFESNNFIPPVPLTAIEATKEDMISLYKDKFVKSAYRNLLVAPFVMCPVCGTRFVETVDHYLPKSIHYIFSVTPINLVPMCFRCNKNKNELDPTTCSKHVFHPYFDNINESDYLKMTFSFDEHNNFIPCFEIIGIGCLEKELYEANYHLFKLKEQYEEESLKLFQNSIFIWQQIFKKAGVDVLKDFIQSLVNSNSDNPIYKPFYISLISDFSTLTSYLKTIP